MSENGGKVFGKRDREREREWRMHTMARMAASEAKKKKKTTMRVEE